jgi:hypothetical protein
MKVLHSEEEEVSLQREAEARNRETMTVHFSDRVFPGTPKIRDFQGQADLQM